MSRSIIYVGMDVHKESVTLAVLPTGAPAPTRVDRLPNDLAKLQRYFRRLAGEGSFGRATKRVAPATCCSAR